MLAINSYLSDLVHICVHLQTNRLSLTPDAIKLIVIVVSFVAHGNWLPKNHGAKQLVVKLTKSIDREKHGHSPNQANCHNNSLFLSVRRASNIRYIRRDSKQSAGICCASIGPVRPSVLLHMSRQMFCRLSDNLYILWRVGKTNGRMLGVCQTKVLTSTSVCIYPPTYKQTSMCHLMEGSRLSDGLAPAHTSVSWIYMRTFC